jgi:hypothetical protein
MGLGKGLKALFSFILDEIKDFFIDFKEIMQGKRRFKRELLHFKKEDFLNRELGMKLTLMAAAFLCGYYISALRYEVIAHNAIVEVIKQYEEPTYSFISQNITNISKFLNP